MSQKESESIYMADYVFPSNGRLNHDRIRRLGEGCFSLKIGGTTYDVSTHYNRDGNQCILDQFQRLILAENLI